MDFVWNRSTAEDIRNECREAMRKQVSNMQGTVTWYRDTASDLDIQANEEYLIASSAMRTETYISVAGNLSRRSVEDWTTRASAQERATDLRNQAMDLRVAATNLDTAIDELEYAITATGELFDEMYFQAQDTDLHYLQQVIEMASAIGVFTQKMENVRDSLNDSFPLLIGEVPGLDGFMQLTGIERAEIVEALLEAALAGEPVFAIFAGDPVNMATGNFIYAKDDITVPGRFPLVFKRFYNTIGGSVEGVMGLNWTHNFNIHLSIEKRTVQITFNDGHIETYQELDNGKYASPLSCNKILLKTEDGWLLRSSRMETHQFDHNGLLKNITDSNDNSIEFYS